MKLNISPSHLVVAALAVGATWAFGQGSLTPPAGVPVPNMKTLAQVEPRTLVNAVNTPGDASNTFVISQPGSYYLAGNLAQAAGKHGISIQANDVTLDLNGFAVIGDGTGTNLCGVNVPVAQTGFRVHNGAVRGWSGGGVQAAAAATLAHHLILSGNLKTGLTAGNGSLVHDCVATGNTTAGFSGGDRTQFSQCASTVNATGFEGTSFVTITDCTANRNSADGIRVQSACLVARCNASRNSNNGITVVDGGTVSGCTANSNTFFGIQCSGTGTSISGCTVQANGSTGILTGTNGLASGNTCTLNANGLRGDDGTRVDGNACNGNTGTGIIVLSSFLVRNTSHGNGTSYELFGNTVNGPMTYSSGGNAIATNSPWANFGF